MEQACYILQLVQKGGDTYKSISLCISTSNFLSK